MFGIWNTTSSPAPCCKAFHHCHLQLHALSLKRDSLFDDEEMQTRTMDNTNVQVSSQAKIHNHPVILQKLKIIYHSNKSLIRNK
jgi:hypothetical protein